MHNLKSFTVLSLLCLSLILVLGNVQAAPDGGPAIFSYGSPGVDGEWVLDGPSSIALDSSGNVYVVDQTNYRVQKFAPGGGAAILSFGTGISGNGADEFAIPTGVAVDSSGNVYVSDRNNNRVQKFAPTGGNAIQTFGTGVQGSGMDQLYLPSGVAVDSAGNVYVVDEYNQRVQKFAPSGGSAILTFGTTGVAGAGAAELHTPSDVFVDSSGNVYVVDETNHRVQKFGPSGGDAILTFGTTGSSGTGASQLYSPKGVAVDSVGNVYVADYNNDRVQKFGPSGGAAILTFGITDSPGNGPNELNSPQDVVVDSAGNVYVVDGSLNDRVQKFTSSAGDAILTIGRAMSGNGAGQLNNSYGVAVDNNGNVYVADTSNNRVMKFPPEGGNEVLRFGTGAGGSSSLQLQSPHGVAVDNAGNVYVADYSNQRIQKFGPGGGAAILTLGTTDVYGNGPNEFSNPNDVAVDNAGYIYVADTSNDRVQKFAPTGGNAIQTFGTGTSGSGLDQLYQPSGVDVDAAGNVYVADTFNNRVQIFSPSGGNAIRTLGTGVGGTGDGQLNRPLDVAVDKDGNVYVADTDNNRIQVFASTGYDAVLSFSPYISSSGISDEILDTPRGIAVSDAGTVYVADTNNSRIQVFDIVDPVITSVTSTTPDGNYATGTAINVTLTFSEQVTLSGGSLRVTLETGAQDAVVVINSINNSKTASGTYTVAAGHSSSDLMVSGVSLDGGATLVDWGGNNADLTLPAGENLSDNSAIVINGSGAQIPTTTPTPTTVPGSTANTLPVANNDTYRTIRNGSFTIPVNMGVLKNDSDADGDALQAVLGTAPENTSNFVLNSDGSFSLSTADGFTGVLTFTYRATDGKAQSSPATVTINVEVPQEGDAPAVEGDLNTDQVEPIFEWHAPEALANAVSAVYEITIVNNGTGQAVYTGTFDANQLCVKLICQLVVEDDLAGEGVLDGALTNGSYTYFIQLTINNVQQEVIQGDEFEVEAPEPVLLDFEIDTSTGRPLIRFPDNNHSLWYQVVIYQQLEGAERQFYHLRWYKKDESLCDVNCLIVPDINPPNGDYQVWIQTWGPAGFSEGGLIGGWVGPLDFTLLFNQPDAVSGLALTATASGRPSFQWNASKGATWYYIVAVNNGDTTQQPSEWVSSISAGCALDTTCTYIPNFILEEGTTYQWWMRAWGPGGYSKEGTTGFQGWTNGSNFTVDSDIPTEPPTLGVPVDIVIEPKGLTYTWEHQPEVSWYQMQVEQTDNLPPGVNPVDYSDWFAVDVLNCRDDSICEVSPPLGLVDGNYRWRVRAYTPAMGTVVEDLWSDWQEFTVQRE